MARTGKRPYSKGLAYDGEFSGIKTLRLAELKQCWFYEFARELPDYRDGIKAWRNQDESPDSPFFANLQELDIFGAHFPQMKEWPAIPYLKIGEDRRAEYRKFKARFPEEAAKLFPFPQFPLSPNYAGIIKVLNDQNGQLETEKLKQLKGLLGMLAWDNEQINKGLELCGWPIRQLGHSPARVTLSIPWSRSTTELKDAFAVLVDYLRQSLTKKFGRDFLPQETRGRNRKDRILEDLKALDAYRQSKQGNRFQDQTVFAHKRQLKKAVSRVNEILEDFPHSSPWVISKKTNWKA